MGSYHTCRSETISCEPPHFVHLPHIHTMPYLVLDDQGGVVGPQNLLVLGLATGYLVGAKQDLGRVGVVEG